MVSALDELYGAKFTEFVAERKRLAAEQKRAGDADGAKEIAAATKPVLSAWVVNQLWRTHHEDFEHLFSLSEEVRRATAGNVGKLRSASEALRSAVSALRQPAEEILRGDGHAATDTTLKRVATTLSSLAALGTFEPDAAGRLLEDRDPPGFGAVAELEFEAKAKPKPPEKPNRKAEEEEKRKEEERRKAHAAAKHALALASKAREHAEKEVAALEAKVEEARAALEAATHAEKAAERALRALEK